MLTKRHKMVILLLVAILSMLVPTLAHAQYGSPSPFSSGGSFPSFGSGFGSGFGSSGIPTFFGSGNAPLPAYAPPEFYTLNPGYFFVPLPSIYPPPPGASSSLPSAGCPFIANGVFSDCGSYYMEQSLNQPVVYYALCRPRSIATHPADPTKTVVCALTGDRWLLLTGPVQP